MLPSAVGQCVAALVAVHGLQRVPGAQSTQCRAGCFISIRNARLEGAALFEESLSGPVQPSPQAGGLVYYSTACLCRLRDSLSLQTTATETWRRAHIGKSYLWRMGVLQRRPMM